MVARRYRLLATSLAVAFVAPLGLAETAFADGPRGDRYRGGHGHHHYHHRHYARPYYAPYGGYLAPGVYLNLPPVVIAPPPVVLTPAPLIVQQPAPRVRCRSWTGSVVIGGRAQPAYGTQCLMPDGTWQLVD
jgi:hypothetical protein